MTKAQAEALNAFAQQHGDEDQWNAQDLVWHDLLLAKIERENKETDDGRNRP